MRENAWGKGVDFFSNDGFFFEPEDRWKRVKERDHATTSAEEGMGPHAPQARIQLGGVGGGG